MNWKDSFHPYATITIVFWSLAYVFTRLALQVFSSFSLGFLRYLIASCTLIVIALATKMKPLRLLDLPWFFLSGAIGFFLYMICFNQGQATVTAATGSVVIATVPVITALQSSTYSIFFGTLLLALFAPTAVHEISHAPAIQFFYLAVLGIGSSAIAYISWAKAFSKAKQTSQVSNYMFITPFLTSIFGFLFAGEIPNCATLIGGGIILTGVLIFNLSGSRHPNT